MKWIVEYRSPIMVWRPVDLVGAPPVQVLMTEYDTYYKEIDADDYEEAVRIASIMYTSVKSVKPVPHRYL